MDFNVNYLPIVVAAVVSMVLGGLWYSPLLFGKIWMNLQGLKMSDMENKPFKLYLLNNAYNLLSMLLMAGILTLWQ